MIELGNNLDLIKKVAENSVHAVISDKPYRIDFMGRPWDKNMSFVPIFKECLRVLVPGGFAFFMSDARQDVFTLDITELKEAGFEVDFDPIEWVYASGFPKAQNFYKAIDRQAFNDWLKVKAPFWDAVLDQCAEGIKTLAGDARTELMQDALRIRHELKVIWAKTYGIELKGKKYGHWGREGRSYTTDSNIFSQDRKEDIVTRNSPFAVDYKESWTENAQIADVLSIDPPITPEAKAVEGMYSAEMKPVREMVIVARKPMSYKTNIEQAIHGHNGGLYLDRARIPADIQQLIDNAKKGPATPGKEGVLGWNTGTSTNAKAIYDAQKAIKKAVGGRLQNPITFGQTEATGYKVRIPFSRGGPIQQDKTGQHANQGWNDPNGAYVGKDSFMDVDLRGRFPPTLLVSDKVLDERTFKKTDEESFSDYFSLDKWWWAQIKHLPAAVQKTFPFLYMPKPSKKEKNAGLQGKTTKVNDGREMPIDNAFQRGETERLNTHVSVKPIWLMCYLIALSPTKVGDIILDPFMGCYDKETEILTQRGWIYFKDIQMTDKIASLISDQIVFCNPLEIQKKYYDGKLIHFEGREIDLAVTPDHRMYISKRKTWDDKTQKSSFYYTDYYFETADKTVDLSKIKRSAIWQGSLSEQIFHPTGMDLKDWFRFLGFWLGDGYYSNGRVGLHISIPRKRNYLSSLMKKFPFEWNYSESSKDCRYYTSEHNIRQYLQKLGKSFEKYIPNDVKNMPPIYLEYLLEGLIESDGCKHKNITYYTSSKQLADDIMEIGLKLNKPCILTQRKPRTALTKDGRLIQSKRIQYIILFSNQNEVRLHRKEDLTYSDYVYCVSVPSKIILVRRNGKPCFCGNSGTTGIACHITGRYFIGYELDPESFAIAADRIAHVRKNKTMLAFAGGGADW